MHPVVRDFAQQCQIGGRMMLIPVAIPHVKYACWHGADAPSRYKLFGAILFGYGLILAIRWGG